MIKDYVQLTKPGIIAGNLIAAVAGFFLAAQGQIDWPLFAFTMLSVILIIASGCTFNNCIDKDIDSKMQRTKDRVLVTGRLSVTQAIVFATITGVAGFAVMYLYTNLYALAFGALGFLVYVGLYSILYKRTTVYSTAIGSISGACPPVIGYVAVANQIDAAAIILLVAFCLWQIPHTYAIAIFRFKDYQKADIPLLPLKDGIEVARVHIVGYTIAFVVASLLLTVFNYTGMIYAITMAALGLYWCYIAVMEYSEDNLQAWGRKMFVLSIITICFFSLLIATDFVVTTTPYKLF